MAEPDAKASVGALLALVAHDLRNPLSALHSNVGFLESALGPKEQDSIDALADIVASCSSLKHIIDNLELLGLSVLDEPPRFERFPSSLWELAADAVQRLEPIAKSYDRIFTSFPEEHEVYSRAGGATRFVGHYLRDLLAPVSDAERAAARAAFGLRGDAPVVALLPGR